MKYILIITIFFSVGAKAQNIDTVLVRNLTLQAQDWAYLVGSWNTQVDSVSMVAYRRMRDKVQTLNIPNWTTNVTIDSLPGKVVFQFYQIAKTANAGEIVGRYTAITNAIAAKQNLAYFIGYLNGNIEGDFNRKRDRGKNLLID